MSLPRLTSAGDLPVGVHRASLQEVLSYFGAGSRHRIAIAERLRRIYVVARSSVHLAHFVVFGSFVTDKPAPNDVDVFFIMEDSFDATQLQGEAALLFDHSAANAHFGASVFWVRRLAAFGGVESTIEHWQVKRDGARRGIVEIVEE